jgi:SAM-dependent methyltransferase
MATSLHSALESYEGVDSLDAFGSHDDISDYRTSLLKRSHHQAEFLTRSFPDAHSVIEACTGNGRLLVAMADQFKVLHGFDIAASRTKFAQSWINDLQLDGVQVWQDNIFSPEGLRGGTYDLALCITGAFGYFDTIMDNGEKFAARQLAQIIKPDGHLLLELYQHPREIAMCGQHDDHTARVWKDLPETDRFRFYLSEYHLEPEKMLLHHNKTFIGRNGEIDDSRNETLKIYSVEDIKSLLKPWFKDFEIYSDWEGTLWQAHSGKMLVRARRHSRTTDAN